MQDSAMQPATNSFRLTASEPSKNTLYGPVLLGVLLVAGGGFFLYIKLEDIRTGRDASTVPALGRPVAMILFGILISTVSIWRLIKGETQIFLQSDHIEAPGQMPQVPYESIREVRHVSLTSWDVVILTLNMPANDSTCVKGRKRVSNMGLVLSENEIALWVSQSGWLASDLCAQICDRIPKAVHLSTA